MKTRHVSRTVLRVRNYVTLRRRGAGIARNATALVSVRCTVHVRYAEAPYVYSVRTLHDVIGVHIQPCMHA